MSLGNQSQTSALGVELANLQFLGVGGIVTAKGFYVDTRGGRTGASFTLSIPAAGGAPAVLPSVPGDAYDVILTLSGATYWDPCNPLRAELTDFNTNYANFPALAAGTWSIGASSVGPAAGGGTSSGGGASGAVKILDVAGINEAKVTANGGVSVVAIDGTAGTQQAVTNLHSSDDNTIPSGGSALGAGVAQLQNLAGTLDNQREAGADNAPSLGLATGVTNPKNVGLTTVTNGGGIPSGATSAILAAASATVNGVKWAAKVGGVINFEPDTAIEESFRIQSVNLGTGAVTFKGPSGAGTANSHAQNSVVTIDCYNTERDISGENDGGRGKGFVVAVEQLYNGGAANGTQNYERARFLQGEKAVFTYLTAAPSAGATSITLNNVTGLMPGSGIDIEDAVGGNERVFVREDYTVGSTTVPLRTGLLFSHAAGNSTTTTANTNKTTTITCPSTANLANGQMVILEPGAANMEIGFVSSFVANTSITLTAATLRNHPSGYTVIWGCVDFDAFDVWGPQSGPLGTGAEEVELMAIWDQPSRAPRMVQTPSSDAMNPSNVLASALMLYNFNSDNFQRLVNATSVTDAASGGGNLPAANWLWNGSSWDRQRGTLPSTLIGSAAYTASQNSGSFANYNHRGIQVVLNVSAASGTGGIQFKIQGQDSVSLNWYDLTALSTNVTATGTTAVELYPGVSGNSGAVTRINGTIPRTVRVAVVAGDASSYTYSISCSLIV